LLQFESERRRGFYFGGGARNKKRDELQFQWDARVSLFGKILAYLYPRPCIAHP
jgi:hypothetical protein